MCGENLAPESAYLRKPRSEIIRQLCVDLAAQLLGYGGTFAGGGDGDLQVSAPNHRSEVEVAVRRIVNAVDKNVPAHGLAVDRRVHFRIIRGRDDEEIAVEIGGFKYALNPTRFGPPLRAPEIPASLRELLRAAVSPVVS